MPTYNGPPHHDAIIIGAGQAGLATAYYLRKEGIDYLILDDQPSPGGAWQHSWPSLRLFSTAGFSNLPGIPMPSYQGFPPASHVVDYFAAYERRYQIPVKRPVHVHSVQHDGRVFRVQSEGQDGENAWTSTALIAATGTRSAPFIPTYPGTFHGKQWHAANYPGPQPFRNSHVAVVGGANSGAQIAAELIENPEVTAVTWYTKHPPRWMPDEVDGRALFHRNRQRFMALAQGKADPGADSALGDIVVLEPIRRARDSGEMKATPMFTSLDEVRADHLIWCTGFRPALGPVRHLIKNGKPQVPGLIPVGYGDWTGPGSATIMGVSPYAREAARQVSDIVR
ncbi:FAD-dependent oxidoreductase [Corynebacterium lowii]|uniref:Putative oxidoreductase CzcO n=1 Tax=Corynebacterium lowii TaxID=1544413 RepID=A0A0Q0U1Q8_9CORY|nr:FAD-dependent oxidoreductase [Corynebacterium lowii]KQB85717.1 putative oxidoreductase CzcO [Corynebacterium lowii]MDP9851019.1 putative flavoprotein involved in K+ transport [Corynebacterium lowii]